MWTDRYTVYYSKEKHYAIRWLGYGRPEEEAQYRKFDDKVEAERFYNGLIEKQGDTHRVELFFSQAKWLCYHANHDEFGTPVMEPIGESDFCLHGEHRGCPGGVVPCTCTCHANSEEDSASLSGA